MLHYYNLIFRVLNLPKDIMEYKIIPYIVDYIIKDQINICKGNLSIKKIKKKRRYN